jgi:2',3'-cyclic-nucleotide 2'-phosphodiesterase (5'-nucleotidase family)
LGFSANVYAQHGHDRPFPPTTVVELGGLRVGVIGIAATIVDKTMPPAFSTGLRFTLGRDELPELVTGLRERERVDLVVLLSHLGFPQDLRLVGEVPGIDVCLGAHTHNRLIRPARRGKTLIIQSGCHGSFLGRLDLDLDGGGVAGFHHRLIPVDEQIVPNPQVGALVDGALAPYRALLDEVVGETTAPLYRGSMLESPMDDLLLQALLHTTGTQIAFSNGWRYGAPIPPGRITLNDLYNIVPMNPPVATVDLMGEELVALIEENLEHTFATDPYQQMGGYLKRALGLRAYIKIENPPGQQLQHLFVGDAEVRPEQEYHVAFVTEQGVPRKYGRNRAATDTRAIEAMRALLTTHRPLRLATAGAFVAV